MNALLDAALGYVARGIPVYPVHWPRPTLSRASLACSCPRGPACDRPAKHPLVRHGIHDATIDPGQLERWWQRWPTANLGLATGICFDALDIDGPAGLAALRQLARAAALRLPGPLVATGAVAGTTGFARPGWATAHPAAWPMSTGAAEEGASLPHPAATAPAAPTAGWSASTTRPWPRSRPPSAACSTPTRRPQPGRPAPPARTWLATRTVGECWPTSWPPSAGQTPGQRNRTLNRCAFKVYRYVAGGVLDDQGVTLAFTTVARAIGLSAAETARTLASARTAGLANPRTVPDLPGPSRQEAGT